MGDDDGRSKLSRRALLGSAATVGVATAGAGAGTYALFQDTESSTGNSVQAGTLDLEVSDDNEGYGDGVSGSWTIENAKPGDSVYEQVSLQNAGSLSAQHVEFDISVSGTEADGPNGSDEGDTLDGASGMAEQFEVVELRYDGTDVIGDRGLDDVNGNGIDDLGDLAAGNDSQLDDLTPPPPKNGGTETFTLEFRWADDDEFDTSVSGTNNDYQGDELSVTVTAALHQASDQDV